MHHNCGNAKRVEHFVPCDWHRFKDLHRAVLMMWKGIMLEEGIREDELSDEEFQRLCI